MVMGPSGLLAAAAAMLSSNATRLGTTPPTTVVVLTCNRPSYAVLAIRQIESQDYRPLEALVVDDGTLTIEPVLRRVYPDLVVLRAGRPATAARCRSHRARSSRSCRRWPWSGEISTSSRGSTASASSSS